MLTSVLSTPKIWLRPNRPRDRDGKPRDYQVSRVAS